MYYLNIQKGVDIYLKLINKMSSSKKRGRPTKENN